LTYNKLKRAGWADEEGSISMSIAKEDKDLTHPLGKSPLKQKMEN
jgi:hypothetical protein